MKLKFVLRVIYILLISVMYCNVATAQALQIIPDAIVFNNDFTDHSDDAITIRNEDGDSYVPREYFVSESNRNNPFAYVIGMDTITIEVMFSDINTNEYDGKAHLILELSYSSTYGIGSVCGLFIPNYDFSKADYREIKFESELPSFVMNDDDFTWNWKIYAIPINASSGVEAGWKTSTTTHNYYTLLAEPKAPMEEPWVSVLDFACNWASGESMADDVATKITEELYSSGINYDAGSHYFNVNDEFELADFVTEIEQEPLANCIDMALAVATFANAVGCDLDIVRFNGNYFNYPFSSEKGFFVNLIDPIGDYFITNNVLVYHPDSIIFNDCREGYFSFHAFAIDSDSSVWDACLRYDIDDEPDNVDERSNTTCGYVSDGQYGATWQLPCDVNVNSYLENLVDSTTYIGGDCVNPLNCGYIQEFGSISIHQN